ncbi:MAG TPA: Ig-like domain repeat protein [Candidatus Acidoferrales bacterium]|nr:Ig-like domain repeat protein [Candidatus Acidoferrales bacterium]
MELRSRNASRCALAACAALFLFSSSVEAQSQVVRPRVTQAIDENTRVTLRGNVHRLARPEFDRGAAPADLRLDRMLLVLKRGPEQESTLQKLLDAQQDRLSPQYHRWLTPEEFGKQFGPAESDIAAITDWLTNSGFQNIRVSRGRTVIEFSGTAAQVQQSLGTPIHRFVVNGEEHWANASDPEIPMALAPVVAGVFSLHNFYKHPSSHLVQERVEAKVQSGAKPQITSTDGKLHALVPSDYYTIYNFNPLQIGTDAKIAIVGRSNINLQDVSYFHFWTNDQAEQPQVILNGPDPGDLGGGEENEAVLDTTWAGAVAPTAWLALVVSKSTAATDGVDLSEIYIIDNNLADIMSESFSDCEANLTMTEAEAGASLAQQAAAQGITYVVSSGDSGAAGCDDPHTEATATRANSVNALASNPYTVAVGGTMFNENGQPSRYWNAANQPGTLASVLSYIPENVWNESCKSGQTGCTKPSIWATGGGTSAFYARPSWQTGVGGIPSDTWRHIPDVSLTAAAHDPYLICIRGSCVPNAQQQISFASISGTSASAPAFAGILALVAQQTQVRLGQPNYVLYRLAAAETLGQCNASSTGAPPLSTCVFNDVTSGNNAVPGETGYGTPAGNYSSGTGYDQATGLGSVNVATLVNAWNSVTFNSTNTNFSISPTTAVHGDPLSVTVNVTPGNGTGNPSGVVWLLQDGFPNGNLVGGNTADVLPLDAQSSFNGVTHLLPGGTYNVKAHYAGDGTYGGSDSSPAIQVTIQREATTTTFSVLTTDAGNNLVPLSSPSPFGTPVYYKAHVSGTSGYGTPGAYVYFWDTNGFGATNVYLDKNGDALAGPINNIAAGPHSITASYNGDNSFSDSFNATPINFTIQTLPTTTTIGSELSPQGLMLIATVNASGAGTPPSGMVTFSNGPAVLATVPLTNGGGSGSALRATASFDGTQLPAGQYSVTASYSGDGDYTASGSTPLPLTLTADFTVADRGITSQTVAAGQTAQYINDIGVTPLFGFASTVSATCTVPAKATTCTVNPNTFSTSSGPNTGSVSVTTTARGAATPLGRFEVRQAPPSWLIPMWAAVLAWVFCQLRRKRRKLATSLAGFVLLALSLGFAMTGCGGGPSGATPPPIPSGTAAGIYTVTVTATAGSTTHTMNLTLVVQ